MGDGARRFWCVYTHTHIRPGLWIFIAFWTAPATSRNHGNRWRIPSGRFAENDPGKFRGRETWLAIRTPFIAHSVRSSLSRLKYFDYTWAGGKRRYEREFFYLFYFFSLSPRIENITSRVRRQYPLLNVLRFGCLFIYLLSWFFFSPSLFFATAFRALNNLLWNLSHEYTARVNHDRRKRFRLRATRLEQRLAEQMWNILRIRTNATNCIVVCPACIVYPFKCESINVTASQLPKGIPRYYLFIVCTLKRYF